MSLNSNYSALSACLHVRSLELNTASKQYSTLHVITYVDNLPAFAVDLGFEFLLTDTKILGTLMETLHLEALL